jgi:hypothetical protein
MPAALYRLAGKPHPTETVDKVVVQVEAPQEAVEPVVTQEEAPVETVVEVPKLVWDASWSRAKLYQFAVDNKVSVTSTMSKNQIIDALNAANSAT